MRVKLFLAAVSAVVGLSACSYVAVATAPRKEVASSRSDAALRADELFWSTFHDDAYDKLAPALQAETGAYLSAPNDHLTAAHIGWLHIWRLAESPRLAARPATITDDARLSRKYFEEAHALHPQDARYLGFLASATLAEADIDHDERATRRGYFMMLDAIKAWPEFNLFTGGYVMSRQPADSPRFKQALNWQWETLDRCVGQKVDRVSAEFAQFMSMETTTGTKRVCWNSWIAPHNLEGFFLNMGDMLVKSGDWKTAQRVYGDAKLSRTYSDWKFRDVLEARIRDAQNNVANFNGPDRGEDAKRIMFATSFSCAACHQN